ncbi:MAG TPA: DJ-1/PfpI family protein [Candidatus Dormibacteraeota bacterium]
MDIGFLVYPRLTALDLVGPWEVLARLPDVRTHLIWTRPGPVMADRGMEVAATVSFQECPPLEVLVIPGGPGQQTLMRHQLLMDFLRENWRTAAWVYSVCTGALLLAQAGLLKGRRVTTHWQAREALAGFGVEVVAERYVFDQNLVSAAGVSAGIDGALALAARIAGEEAAQAIQLSIEYDPRPPFEAGSPSSAPRAVVNHLESRRRAYT